MLRSRRPAVGPTEEKSFGRQARNPSIKFFLGPVYLIIIHLSAIHFSGQYGAIRWFGGLGNPGGLGCSPQRVNSRLYQFLTLGAEKNEIGIDWVGPARGLALLKWITQSIAPRRYSLAYLFTAFWALSQPSETIIAPDSRSPIISPTKLISQTIFNLKISGKPNTHERTQLEMVKKKHFRHWSCHESQRNMRNNAWLVSLQIMLIG